MKSTIAKFLATNPPKIAYKTINTQEIRLQCIEPNGIGKEILSFPIDENTTVGQLRKQNLPKCVDQKITKIVDGIIMSIVEPETRAIDLMNDAYQYRINQFYVARGDDLFFISVSFMGNNREELFPILVQVSNGKTLTALKMDLVQTFLPKVYNTSNFELAVDPKWTHTIDNNQILSAPLVESNEIPLVCVSSDL